MEADSSNDNKEVEKERKKVPFCRSISKRWTKYRNRRKSDGRTVNDNSCEIKPLTISKSTDAVDRLALSDCADLCTSLSADFKFSKISQSTDNRKLCASKSFSDVRKNRLYKFDRIFSDPELLSKKELKDCRQKGKSLDRLCSLATHMSSLDRSGGVSVIQTDSGKILKLRSVSAPPSKATPTLASLARWEGCSDTPLLPAPLQPVQLCSPVSPSTGGQDTLTDGNNIYASRQEWLTMAKAHRSSLKEKLQEDFLSCKICLESYQRPKALPCLHSFCEHCLRDYVRRHTGTRPGHFPCPMCRKDIRIPDGGIEKFQDNFLLSSLSDTLEEDDVWQDPHQHQLSPPRSLAPPTPLEQKLKDSEWYFGKVSRNASEEWLLSTGYPKGSFLLRQGEASPDTLTLSVRDCDELRGYIVKHYKVYAKRMDNPAKTYYYITPKRMFKSLEDLINHYLDTADGLCCKLTQVCGKPRSLSWALERNKEDDYTTSRESLLLVKRIGSGQFADVWLGKWNHREVAVKIQRPDAVKMAAFLDESQILKTLDHPNILKLLAVCNAKEPIYLVTKYLENGRLSLYLREGKGSELKLTQLIWICAQVADALAYMEKEKFIHRNLGARNILVGEQNKVMVAGFGMTKCADDPDFNFRRGLKMAIKWMAPEVLLYNKYSTKADVWSFGILMMEVFTHGKEPYEGMGSKEAFENVQQGYRMPCPDLCPAEIFDVILSCWSTNPPSRPNFDFLNSFLHDWQSPT